MWVWVWVFECRWVYAIRSLDPLIPPLEIDATLGKFLLEGWVWAQGQRLS